MTISNERLMGLRLADEQNRVNKKGGMPAFEPRAAIDDIFSLRIFQHPCYP